MANEHPITQAEVSAIIETTTKMATAMANTGAAVSVISITQQEIKSSQIEQDKVLARIDNKINAVVWIAAAILGLASLLEVLSLVHKN